MTEFTEGSWITQAGSTTGREIISPSAPKSRRVVARCGGQRRDGNAVLIAAAPDMLAALKHIEAIIDDGGKALPTGPAHQRILDAIAKAEGR